jgi:uncharacterized repeat protein (TIGR01451 family)/LPXTG-motif cell wall-anchored protein
MRRSKGDMRMSHQRQRSFAMSLLLTGLLVTLLSFGGGWGEAYGQTAGPTPTPGRTAVISVTKEADNPRPRPGAIVVFTIRVQNVGDTPARNVVVQDNLPGTFEILDATTTAGTATVRGPMVRVDIPQLNPGASAVITIRARLRPDARGRLVNTVIVRATNVAGEAIAEQQAEAALDVDESAGTEPTAPGGGAQNPGDSGGNTGDNSGSAPGGGAQNPRGSLGNTGADSSMQWWLLLLGILLMAAGSTIYWRARRTR